MNPYLCCSSPVLQASSLAAHSDTMRWPFRDHSRSQSGDDGEEEGGDRSGCACATLRIRAASRDTHASDHLRG